MRTIEISMPRAGGGASRQWLLRGTVIATAAVALAACAGPLALDGNRGDDHAGRTAAVIADRPGGAADRQDRYASQDQRQADADVWGAAFQARPRRAD